MQMVRVAVGVVRESDRILITRRLPGAESYADLWELPGGKVESGEADVVAVERELHEELGVVARATRSLGEWPHEVGSDKRIVLVPFECVIVSGEPAPLASVELRWVPIRDLRAYAFPPASVPLIEALSSLLIDVNDPAAQRPA